MNRTRAFLIQEPRSYTSSFELLKDALAQAGFTVEYFGAKPPESTPWNEDLHGTTLFLGSLLLDPLTKEQKEKLTAQELKELEKEREGYPLRWAEYIRGAISRGAGLVAMLDSSTAKTLVTLDLDGAFLPVNFKKFSPKLNPDVTTVIFRPLLTEAGNTHPATSAMAGKRLPPFGSIYRSYYRTVAQVSATVLMEIPEYVDDCAYPFLIVREVGKNRIALMAADWCNTGGQEFIRWPDASVLLSGLGRWAAWENEPYPISTPPAHWFLKYDRKQTIQNWQAIENKLSNLKSVNPPPVTGSVQTLIESSLDSEQACRDAPRIIQDNDLLEAKLGNGLIVRLNKAAMQVGYRRERPGDSDLVLAMDPPADAKAVPPISPWPWQKTTYKTYEVEGGSLKVIYCLDCTDPKIQSHLYWIFTPKLEVIEGVKWTSVGETFALQIPQELLTTQALQDKKLVHFEPPLHRWRIGKTIEGHSSCRFACHPSNRKPRGFRRVQFNNASEEQGDPFHWFYSGQPFQMLTYEDADAARTLWCYTTTAAAVRSEMCKTPGQDYIALNLSVELGRQTGTVQLPTFWYCFAEQGFSHNLWLAAYDYIRHYFQKQFGIKRTYPRPTAMLRYHFTYLNELRHYADTFVPLAKELGFKRIECGVRYVNDLFFPLHGGIEALRYLCNKAHETGIEVIFYCGASWCHDGHPSLGPLHICDDWLLKTPKLQPQLWQNPAEGRLKNTEYQALDGLDRRLVLVSLRSDWYKASLDRYADLKSRTGIDGVWLDSWSIPNSYHYVNYAEPAPAPAVAEAIRYVADLQKRGYLVLVEGQSPVALESFWYGASSYAPLCANEFALSGMAPFASNDDGLLTDDLFRLLAYGCAMFQDIRLLADENDAVTQKAKMCNTLMNTIHEKLGWPLRVRELSVPEVKNESLIDPSQECEGRAKSSAIGTFWACEKGFAIFGLRTVDQLRIRLPLSKNYEPLAQGTTAMKLIKEGEVTYLEGKLMVGDVVLLKAH